MSLTRKERREFMTKCVEEIVLPRLIKFGFERCFFPKGLDRKVYQLSPFGRLQLVDEENQRFNVVYVNFGSYERQRFSLSLSAIPFTEELSPKNNTLPPERMWAACADVYYLYCLYPEQFGLLLRRHEFGPRVCFCRSTTKTDIVKSVEVAASFLNEIDDCFRSAVEGPHLLRFPISTR